MKVVKDQTFWLGAMSALAIVFFLLFVGVVSGKVSFGEGSAMAPKAPVAAGGYGDAAPAAGTDARTEIATLAVDLKINKKKLESCLDDGTHTQTITDAIAAANAAGGNGTPYSVIEQGGEYVVMSGALPLASVLEAIDGFATAPKATDITVEAVSGDELIRGNVNAPITIIEYSDIDCPFCQRFHGTMNDVVSQRDDVRWVYRHLPLPQLHPDASVKAEAVECVKDVDADQAWELLDALIG